MIEKKVELLLIKTGLLDEDLIDKPALKNDGIILDIKNASSLKKASDIIKTGFSDIVILFMLQPEAESSTSLIKLDEVASKRPLLICIDDHTIPYAKNKFFLSLASRIISKKPLWSEEITKFIQAYLEGKHHNRGFFYFQKKIHTLTETTHEIVCFLSPEAKIIKANKNFYDKTEYTLKDTNEKDFSLFINPQNKVEFQKKTLDCIEHGFAEFDINLLKKNKKIIYGQANISPIFNYKNEIKFLIICISDKTQEYELKHQNEDANKNIKDLFKEAKTANLTKNRFLANMSHEIRTPMNAIIGYTDMLFEDELTEDQRNSLHMIMESANNLLHLLNDILDFSKIESDQLLIQETTFNLSELIFNCFEKFKQKLKVKQIELLCNIEEGINYLIGDPKRINQIIYNLIDNALKFTKKGEVYIEVKKISEDKDLINLRFTIKDTGIGIPEKKIENIFDAFTQADNSMTRKFGGSGLGLALCKRLVELMKGQITVSSKLGEGSTFNFNINLKKIIEQPLSETKSEVYFGKRCLIIDNSQNSLNVLKNILSSFQITSKGVSDYSLLNKSNLNEFDFIICDITPLLLKEPEFLKDKDFQIPVIVTYDQFMETKFKELKNIPYVATIQKPLRKKLLLDLIEKIFTSSEKLLLAQSDNAEIIEKKLKNLKVLLVEDNEPNQQMMLKMLNKFDVDVDLAEDGVQALEKGRTKSFDLIFMDVQMPMMDGLEATRELRYIGITTPIIAMTAHAMMGDREECFEAGVDFYIPKPIKRDQLKDLLDKYSKKYLQETGLPRRILAVEDDSSILRLIEDSLSVKLPEVTLKTAQNGIYACTLLGSFLPDLVIMDLAMPDMDGVSMIKLLRTEKRYEKIPIIVITGLPEEDPRVKKVKEFGIQAFFFKPFNFNELILTIKQIFNGITVMK